MILSANFGQKPETLFAILWQPFKKSDEDMGRRKGPTERVIRAWLRENSAIILIPLSMAIIVVLLLLAIYVEYLSLWLDVILG
jgi:hypothetical protein